MTEKRIQEILNRISKTPDCFVASPQGIPEIAPGHKLPGDLLQFYSLCGGVTLFNSSAYRMTIVPPDKFTFANPIMFAGLAPEEVAAIVPADDISWSWYLVGEGDGAERITIDLAPERNGRCYDSFWDSYAMPGYSPIIAFSFTELLLRLLENQGDHWYWCRPDFKPLGDAYD